ncbi:hypothetical protein Vretimale_13939, partial [Volvox reticuliferus]
TPVDALPGTAIPATAAAGAGSSSRGIPSADGTAKDSGNASGNPVHLNVSAACPLPVVSASRITASRPMPAPPPSSTWPTTCPSDCPTTPVEVDVATRALER